MVRATGRCSLDKKAGRSLKLNLPELVECSTCKGSGKIKPMFHEMPCDGCNGSGYVDKETGEAIPEHILIPAMKAVIKQLKFNNYHLKKQLCELDDKRYPDQMPVMNNGTYRMD